MPVKFFLEIHDFGMLLPGMDNLLKIKEIYPNFKITAFTIPMPKEFFLPDNQKHFTKDKYRKWAEIVNSYDWLEVGMHGFAHTYYEFDCVYDKAAMALKAGENLWKVAGLKYKKLFVAPYWQYSYDALNALKDGGWAVGVDRNHPIPIPKGLKTFTYNWSYDEELPKGDRDRRHGKIIGHGHYYHTEGSRNAIDDCYYNIIRQIPKDAEFGFISELMEGGDKSEKNNQKSN